MQINSKKVKEVFLSCLPYLIFAYVGNKIGYAFRIAEGKDISEKLLPFLNGIGASFGKVLPSFNPVDILVGIAVAGIMKAVLYVKSKKRKKFRQGEEYGSAVWGTEKDISFFNRNFRAFL